MRLRLGIIVALLAATALLALAGGGASARSFSFTERNFELIWNSALTGKTKVLFRDAASRHIECNLTLLGRYAANTIAKSTGVNQGTINHGETESCVNGSVTVRTETMPWNLRYRSFTGTLPAIRTIATSLLGGQFRVADFGGASCTFRTEILEPLVLIREGVGLELISVEEGHTLRLSGLGCTFVSPGNISGIALSINLPRTGSITVALI